MTVVLLHDLGDPVGGAAWRSAAPHDWIVPDLPGHGSTPAVRTGHYDPMSAVALARWTLAREATDVDAATTLVGVGHNAHAALVGAAGGDWDRVVIVDGLWGPWRDPAEEIDAFYAMIRAIAADPAATGRPPLSGLDPRASYGYGVMSSTHFARRFWGTVDQPVLAIETPRSTTPPDERMERTAWFGGATTLVELDAAEAAAVVDAIKTWRTIR
jgi:pimeloyl-ACP methyl ester carboxylesterase